MTAEPTYLNAGADPDRERRRLRHLEACQDPATVGRLEAAGVREGWRCLEAGAGAGSITRWLAGRVGTTGRVTALDLDVSRLTGLPANVDVRRHDLLRDELEPGAYDLVHARMLLMHLADPAEALARLAAAVAPGGTLLLEEGDFGLFELSGSPTAAVATRTWHAIWSSADLPGPANAYFGRRLPGLVSGLVPGDSWPDPAIVVETPVARPGEPGYESLRLAWPEFRRVGEHVGVAPADLDALGAAFDHPDTLMVGITTVAVTVRRHPA